MKRTFVIALFAVFFCLNERSALAQFGPEWNHPELKWSTIETEHFFVHFHNGAEHTGKVTAKIAEDIFEPITSLYNYKPDGKIHFVIKDYDDFSNGAAYYLDNKVEIWASALDFELRGTHNWLRNVITHEFTHMISLGAARKITRRIPAFYVQGFGYEDEKRPDVLYGYPNRILSYPIPMTVVPPWWAEGVAQYQRPQLEYDLWDSHRDMLLRTATVESKLLTYSEMNSFGKNSIGSERVYNQGYSFSGYIAERYGIESLRAIANNMRSLLQFSFDSAIKKATGKSGSELYREWKQHLEEDYAQRLRDIQAHRVEGELLQKEGTANFFPRWSPDGKSLAYLTNEGFDYLGQTVLVVREQATGKVKGVKGGVHYSFAWSHDGKRIFYSRKSEHNPSHSALYDLYVYDLSAKKEERLTHGARAQSPSLSPDGKTLACVVNGDGTQNLALFNLESKQFKQLTHYKNQEQVYTPQWSPDGQKILFSYSQGRGRELYWFDLASNEASRLQFESAEASSPTDQRDAVFSTDGKHVYFSWDRTGIFNIYSLELESKQITPRTNVVGGAFMPSINAQGELAFSSFVAEGYKIALLKNPQPLAPEVTTYFPASREQVQLASNNGNHSVYDVSAIKHGAYDDRTLPDYQTKSYRNQYTAISILPLVRRDYGTTKLGSYFYSSDMLDKYTFIGGVAANRKKDYDLFLLFDYRKFGPTLFLEAFNQVRHNSTNDEELGELRFRYNLTEVALGTRFSLSSHDHSKLSFIYDRYNANIKYEVDNFPVSFGYTYFQGKTVAFEHRHEARLRAVDGEINPRAGRDVHFRYAREYNSFIHSDADQAFTLTDYGTFVENYEPHNLHRFELDWTERFAMPARTGLTFYGRGGLLSRNVDSFFYFFAGGLDGVRGYPFYSMEGRYLMHGRVTYRVPLFNHMDFSLLHLYFDKIALAASYDYGGAFVKTEGFTGKLHDSVNLQLRAELFSFYGFPTRVSFDAAYGFDQFKNRGIQYGKEWRYYVTVAFDFFGD